MCAGHLAGVAGEPTPPGELVDAIVKLIDAFVAKFGVGWTIVMLVGLVAFLVARRIYNDRREDRDVNKALEAKEAALQLAAAEARSWRIVVLKEKCGWTNEEVEQYIIRNDFSNPVDARRSMEQRAARPSLKRLDDHGNIGAGDQRKALSGKKSEE
jgi:hypothetical protein